MLLLAGCIDPHTAYHNYRSTPLEGWPKTDTLCFALPPLDSTRTYHLTVAVRSARHYPYRNLWLVVEQSDTLGLHRHRDTLNCTLIAPDGASPSGITLHQHEFPVPTPLLHPQGSTLRIYHLMQREALPGISDVGLHLRKE